MRKPLSESGFRGSAYPHVIMNVILFISIASLDTLERIKWSGTIVISMNETEIINNELHRLMELYPGYEIALTMKKLVWDDSARFCKENGENALRRIAESKL
jgi:hypothetical protein